MSKALVKPSAELRARAQAAMRRAIVDEYGDLVMKMRPFKPDAARLLDLAKAIRAWYADEDATLAFTARGDHYDVLLGAKGNETRIEDMQAVYDAMGHADFIRACSMTMGALEKNVVYGRFVSLTVKEQTGSRSLTLAELAD
jgi:hypothetical protein